jgi:hypothetical protein
MSTTSRPISGVSARSQTTTSGNTVYFDARSRPSTPATPMAPPVPPFEFPIPITSAEGQARLARSPADNRVTLSDSYQGIPSNPPPAYDDTSLPRLRNGGASDEVDVLDLPVPAPASSFSTRPVFPPGLLPLPLPSVWSKAYTTDHLAPAGSRDSAAISIDIEDEPPTAQESWKNIATDREGRRQTFGAVSISSDGKLSSTDLSIDSP